MTKTKKVTDREKRENAIIKQCVEHAKKFGIEPFDGDSDCSKKACSQNCPLADKYL